MALGTISIAPYMRQMRGQMLEALNADYVRTARAKGLSEWTVVWRHAVRNALIPVVTLVALQMPTVFGGAIVTEQIFRVPGIGSLLIMAGRGMRSGAGTGSEDVTAPYSWGTPGTSDDVPMRWGFNQVEFNYTDPNGAKYLITDFDAPGAGTGIDGQAALGDSGGGAFIYNQGAWKLGGVAYATADGSDADALTNPAGYGDYTLFTNVYSYRSEISALTGTLVPEPSSMLLGVSGVLALALRRKR